ncbi:hypothetical protein [Streptomyces guryensis]|uniref:Uncharacterized protein n=1 Tax=Streptomyces guryensis TaxID=2886947 RepID=A0A9Q3VLJ1_9ACTN|nr:hypothetical protein [Streptomyces guryensis]MCD9874764.1 hypothetical protein [Streptomyces guryensis]
MTGEDGAGWNDQEVLRLSDAPRVRREKYPQVTARTAGIRGPATSCCAAPAAW